jgi:shikimate kinase / 3-dehydroquinate synthase
MNIILAGFMGAGKTTVGEALARTLDRTLIDTDAEIVRREGRPIAAIFEADGEAHFRALEAALVADLARHDDLIIATGGGLVINDANRALLKQAGITFFLAASPAALAERLGADAAEHRPMLRGAPLDTRIAQLLLERGPKYAELHYRVETDQRTPDDIAQQITAIARAEQMRLTVAIPGERPYDIVMGDGLLEHIGAMLSGRGWNGPAAIIGDAISCSHYAGRVLLALRNAGMTAFVHSMPYGEQHKTLTTVERMYRAFSEHGMERSSPVIALGGGVVGDTAGFAAATYLRGVPFVQIPTTLLAMADSSIGGKTGVDTSFGKNLVGAFKQPDLVVIDTSTLLTLPAIELRCGLAEIIKAGVLKGGSAWDTCKPLAHSPLFGADAYGMTGEDSLVDDVMMRALLEAILLKREVVEEDPHERGRRAILNLGHTFGHGIESWCNYRLKHGYAISLGMVCAMRTSVALGLATQEFSNEVISLLRGTGLPVRWADVMHLGVPPHPDVSAILQMMQSDKKKRAGKLRFVLARAPGDIVVSGDVTDDLIMESLRSL